MSRGAPAPATEQAEWERVLLGTWCSCPCTTTSICPVPQSCGHSCVPTPLLGTRHPTASLQQVKVEARGGRLLQLRGRSGHDRTHKAWHLQGRDGWAWTGISMWADIVQERGQQELSCTHRADEGRVWEEQQQARGLFQAGLPQEAGGGSHVLSHRSSPSLLHTQSSGCVL